MSRIGRAFAGLAVVAVLVSGCTGTAGSAAIVNGKQISQSDVADAHALLAEIAPGGGGPTDAMLYLVNESLMTPVAEKYGVGLQDEQIRDMINLQRSQLGLEPLKEVTTGGLNAFRYLIYTTSLPQSPNFGEINETLGEVFKEADITINPRFGSIDENKQFNAPSYPWIAGN